MEQYKAMLQFMIERHQIYLRRRDGAPPPWTSNQILRHYRFCNVYRELDKVTVWIREHIREEFDEHPHLWFMLCIARQINLPTTLAELIADKKGAWPSRTTWDWERACTIMRDRAKRGEKVYTSAYMLRGPIQGDPSGFQDKPRYTTNRVLLPVWQCRKQIEPELHHESLQTAHTAFLPHHGWGGFLAYEVVSDLRWTRYLEKATDINTWANAGPGAKRGLNRLYDRKLKGALSDDQALAEMQLLHRQLQKDWPRKRDWPALEMREVEHSLCEFDKYSRAEKGEGRPKESFNP